MGAKEFRIGYSDEEDGEPVVWYATASFSRPGGVYHDATAAMDPLAAAFRLVELFCDGGTCTHCAKPTGVVMEPGHSMPGQRMVCWFAYDPEMHTFRRGCEGVMP
jgi:hypothetical protein